LEYKGKDKLRRLPVPVKLTTCGLVASLSVIVRVPVRVPLAEGVKVTSRVQVGATAKDFGHEEAKVKSPRLVVLEMVSGVLPRFVNVMSLAALLVPTV
jgi:hypothetical protein